MRKRTNKRISPTVVSLFAGCGGLDLGFKEEGFNLVYACDNDSVAVEVYKRNIDSRAYVRDVTTDIFHDEILSLGKCDVVLGGFPCQGFSKAGPKRQDDSRNLLYLEMKKAVAQLQPEIFIAENVDGLSQNFKGQFTEYIVRDFKEIGYEVDYRILNAGDYGVPQHRRRIFFVGQKKSSIKNGFRWPVQSHNCQTRNGEKQIVSSLEVFDDKSPSCLKKAVSIKDSIADLRRLGSSVPDHRITNKWKEDYNKIIARIGEGQKLCNVRFSETSVYTWDIPEVFGEVDNVDVLILEAIGKNRRHKKYGNIPNGNPLSETIIKELTGIDNLRGNLEKLSRLGYLKEKMGGYDLKGAMFCSGLFKRPLWSEPSPTVLTNFHNPRYFIHPLEDRPFSLRECARLQGFPDNFLFTDNHSVKQLVDGYRLVGNAVAPPLSKQFAISVKSFFCEEGEPKDEVT